MDHSKYVSRDHHEKMMKLWEDSCERDRKWANDLEDGLNRDVNYWHLTACVSTFFAIVMTAATTILIFELLRK